MPRTNAGSVPTTILEILREAGEPLTAAELREAIDRNMSDDTIPIALRRMAGRKLVRRIEIEQPTRHGPRVRWAV
jgi:repressor of nif and glnA expression